MVGMASAAGDGQVLRVAVTRQNARLIEAPPVIGVRNRSSATSACSPTPPANRASSEAGNRDSSTGGMKQAEAIFQNCPAAKEDNHQSRHRVTVRRLTPRASASCR